MKGLIFDGLDDPKLPRGARTRWARIAALRGCTVAEVADPIIATHNERWAVVDVCPEKGCGRELIAGEFEPHFVNAHVSGRSRSLVRQIREASPEASTEALAAVARLVEAKRS